MCVCVHVCVCVQVFCEVEVKRLCLSQANADLLEAAEKLEALRKKLTVSVIHVIIFSVRLSAFLPLSCLLSCLSVHVLVREKQGTSCILCSTMKRSLST